MSDGRPGRFFIKACHVSRCCWWEVEGFLDHVAARVVVVGRALSRVACSFGLLLFLCEVVQHSDRKARWSCWACLHAGGDIM